MISPRFLALLVGIIVHSSNAQAEKIKIGVLLPLSGNYAPIGRDNQLGIDAAVKSSKIGDKIEIVYADSKADAASSVSEFKKMIELDKVSGVYAMRGPVGMAVNPLSKQSKVPLLGGVGNKVFAASNEYAFQAWSSSDSEGELLANVFKHSNFKKVAIVTAEDDWTVSVSDALVEHVAASKIEVVYEASIAPSESDLRTFALRVKQKQPDVVFVNLSLAQIGPFIKHLREQRFQGAIYSNFWSGKKEVSDAAGLSNMQGVAFIEMSTELASLKKEIPSDINVSAAAISSYMATLMFSQAIKSEPQPRTAGELYQALLKINEIHAPEGDFKVVDRYIQFPMVLKVIQSGKPVIEKNL